jgi:hypothetical protein
MEGTGTTVWKVENGLLVSPGNGSALINNCKFVYLQESEKGHVAVSHYSHHTSTEVATISTPRHGQ